MATVAAENEQIAEEALSLIRVDYEDLPSVAGLEAAFREGSPKVHEEAPNNIWHHEHVEKGDVEQGFAEADEVFENHFTFPMVYHYSLEPHSVIADFGESEITVWSSAQHPFPVQKDISGIFRVPPNRIKLIVPYLGGGFGSKSSCWLRPREVCNKKQG